MFRPEMLRPMGLPEDVNVIAWGLGLERYKPLICSKLLLVLSAIDANALQSCSVAHGNCMRPGQGVCPEKGSRGRPT